MKNRFASLILLLFIAHLSADGQNSVLVNLGSSSCAGSEPGIFLVKNPFGATPSLMAGCSLKNQVPDYYSIFTAYNPKDNKVYVADNRTGVLKIWVLDAGLPGSVACPASISTTPDFTLSYMPNNFEFDNNGDLWSLANYDSAKGICSIDKYNIQSDSVTETRVLKFPVDHFPTTLFSGDICILPNGRMFATLGYSPSVLYEITNYNTGDTATATYLATMPQNCFGIAYLNGMLEITGLGFSCYYYQYNISNNTLSSVTNFQNGLAPIDNTSFTPTLGTTKMLEYASLVDATTADVTYEIYTANLGNTILNNINVTEDLGAVFGAANISNLSVAFSSGANAAGLTMNPLYDGITNTSLLSADQQLPNRKSANSDYFFKIKVSFRVHNIEKGTTYYNSAIGTAIINNAVDPIFITDSSNNGDETFVDPDNDGNPGGINENIPTPLNFAVLPVKFLNLTATLTGKNSGMLNWIVATPTTNAISFEPQYSTDGANWKSLSSIAISNKQQSSYLYEHVNLPEGKTYYRIKQTDDNGYKIYSKTVFLQRKATSVKYNVYPNPANNTVHINASSSNNETTIKIFDATGRQMSANVMTGSKQEINTSKFNNGTYLLQLTSNNQTETFKLIIRH